MKKAAEAQAAVIAPAAPDLKALKDLPASKDFKEN